MGARIREPLQGLERLLRPRILRLSESIDPDGRDPELARRSDVVEETLRDVDMCVRIVADPLTEDLPVPGRGLVRADLAGDDRVVEIQADPLQRGVQQLAVRVGEDRELPAALSRLDERRRRILEHRPIWERARESARLTLR
jgi:hypothetical protein